MGERRSLCPSHARLESLRNVRAPAHAGPVRFVQPFRFRPFPNGITVAQSVTMVFRWMLSPRVDHRFERLQDFILGLRTGDAVRTEQAARVSGLPERWCHRALQALAAAGVMSNEYDGRFVRRRGGLRPSTGDHTN